ncbi:MAG: class I tRNA ligase family protein, partial [Myxococcota bacterium]|nr:class I tRNA ligase family protein [Myxococcota bacterium]
MSRQLRIYNTNSRKVEPLEPQVAGEVSYYSCGPTVYGYAHLGNLRTYVFTDVLRRVLEFDGNEVTHVMNVTDVGHMTTDEDEGEDKMEATARERGQSPWEVAQYYTDAFGADMDDLNLKRPTLMPKATDHIECMLDLIQRLEDNGYAYLTDSAVYYDTAKFRSYGNMAGLNLRGQEAGARVGVDPDKRSPRDFALWKVNQPNHIMQWDSPWGRGYPGWHLECSAMSMKYLGETLDLHSGGIDHIPVHHTNEIAQSE